jgi:hypothetical protein
MSVDQLVALGVVGGDAGRQLTPVLNILQHSRKQPAGGLRPVLAAERADLITWQMIDGGDAALVVYFAHPDLSHEVLQLRRMPRRHELGHVDSKRFSRRQARDRRVLRRPDAKLAFYSAMAVFSSDGVVMQACSG